MNTTASGPHEHEYLDMNFVDEKSPEWLKYFIVMVHPNDAGYEKYAFYITAYLDSFFMWYK